MRNLQVYRYLDTTARLGSIRKAAEHLAITPSALNRRILALEEELGVQVLERLGRGVRLSTAGELLIGVFRKHLAEAERVKSQIADLSGLRRGHVNIACSQALLPYFLPMQISRYQESYSKVTFGIQVKDGEAAEQALLNYTADLAIVFEPLNNSDFFTIQYTRQPIHAVMAKNHPLSGHAQLHLSDCLAYPLALPAKPYAVRHVIEGAADKLATKLTPAVEAESYILLRNFAAMTRAIAFEIKIGVPPDLIDKTIVSIPLSLPGNFDGALHLAQLRDRTLPVAAARFAAQLSETFVQGANT